MITTALLLLLQVAGAEPEPASMTTEAPAAEETMPAQQVQKPKKVCRMVSDPRLGPLTSRRKVCRTVSEDEADG